MPVMNPGITPDLVRMLRNGDDAALEQIFHARFESVRGRAAQDLEAASAARVTERVFVALWRDRERLESVDDVEAALTDLTKAQIARERARLAAVHRFEESEHVHPGAGRNHSAPPEEVLWSHVSSAIHAPPPDAERTAHLRADHSRHSTAEHVEAIAHKSEWKGALALGVGAVVIGVGLIWALDRASAPARVEKALAAADVRTLNTNSGQRGAIDLRDGGRVQLGPRSTLTIPAEYGDELRAIRVEGSALVQAADGDRPIDVRIAGSPLAILGSHLRVSAYPGAREIFVGAVDATEVRLPSETRTLPAGSTLAIASSGAVREPTPAEVDEMLGWTEGQFVVNDRPLRDALDAMRLAYGSDISVTDPALLERRVSVRAPLTSSRDAIAALETSGKLAFGYVENQMVMRDSADPAARPRRR